MFTTAPEAMITLSDSVVLDSFCGVRIGPVQV